jgi:hypothetical protein
MARVWKRFVRMAGGLLLAVLVMALLKAQQARVAPVAINPDDIGGIVTSAKGSEAGVWVIAETTDLSTKYRKIVVTDDRGRFVIPDLPPANYRVWVRGYGLVDSQPTRVRPGNTVDLKATVAPDAKAAAQIYPGSYWLSLLEIPPRSAFPMDVPAPPNTGGADAGPFAGKPDPRLMTQAEWIFDLKRGCEACHQMGGKATREIPPNLGTFDSPSQAFLRLIRSGQIGSGMVNQLDRFGHDRGLAFFADWVTRIAKGEVPPAPPRPQGIERNVVITLQDFDSDRAFVHDIISTNKRNPTENANGPIYGPDWSAGAVAVLDPAKHTKTMIPAPMTIPEDRNKLRTWSPQTMSAPSLYWGEQIVWNDPVNPNQPHMDSKGRVWYNSQTRAENPAFCKSGSANPFARNYPLDTPGKGLVVYDPRTGASAPIDLCFGGQHAIIAGDKDETMYFSSPASAGGLGWLNTRIWDETHDAEKAQGWCPAVIDYNGDGETGPWTTADKQADPKLDRGLSGAQGYGIAWNPVDGSLWIAAGTLGGSKAAVPGKLLRMTPGAAPPATCKTEVYEPPFHNPKVPGVEAYFPQGVDADTNGVIWTALNGGNYLASFDRRRCTVLNGPSATGQHCPEGWTLYPIPGPKFKGDTDEKADYYYYNWVDRYNTLGLGANVPIVNGTGSDSLIAFLPDKRQFINLRVPYPLGFYTRGMDGRIDDPNGGWKGRGVWAANNDRVSWLKEGGKGETSFVAHFQIRPDPLAK